ncbi:MAG: ELWxxDGT repeat protein [Cyanobacteria bacterium J06633_8]
MGQNLTPSLIKDINPGAASSNPKDLISFNGELYFLSGNEEETRLFKSDGTAAGTVENFLNAFFDKEFEFGGNVTDLIATASDRLFFDGTGRFPFGVNRFVGSTDGTAEGISQLSFLAFGGNRDSFTSGFVLDSENFNGKLAYIIETVTFVAATNFPVDTKLFVSDATQSGTNEIFAIDKNSEFRDLIKELTNVNGTLFFTVVGNNGIANQLWKSDGTNSGTVLVKNVGKNSFSTSDGSINLTNLTDINGMLFFSGEDKDFIFNPETKRFDSRNKGVELFKSDGTASGTVVIKDINPGEASSNPDKLTDVNGTAYFVANDGKNGTELWKSDGTESGTILVKDIISGSGGSNPDNLTNVNGTLFFTVNDGSNGTELWKSDGTQSGTNLVKNINPGGNSSNPDNLTVFQNILYFTADDGSNGVELWKSDGSESGTVLVGDINPGNASSNPQELTVVDGELYFSADDGSNGRELWGLTEGGTQPNQDLILGTDSNDVLLGKEQDNIIDGLKGNDTLTGGSGKDVFVLSSEFGNDLITDFTLGEDEIINATSRIVFTTMADGDSLKVAFSNTGDVLQVNLNGNEQGELENYLLSIGSNQNLPY